jgi:hypothetical protein
MHKTIEKRMVRDVVPDLFTAAEARRLLDDGASCCRGPAAPPSGPRW